MGKKLVGGLFAGILGAGLYAAYQKLDETKKNRLKRDLRDKTDELRDRAVDYAFYASDAVSDLKDVVKDEVANATQNAKDKSADLAERAKSYTTSNDDAETPTESEQTAQDDIIVDAKDAFGSHGADSSTSTTPEATGADDQAASAEPESDSSSAESATKTDSDN